MSRIATILPFALILTSLHGPGIAIEAQQSTGTSQEVMLAAVSRDRSMLEGGISSSAWTRKGTVRIEPLVMLTTSGVWKSMPCHSDRLDEKSCLKFEREYLKKPHTYTVIGSDGRSAIIHARPSKLDDCYGFTGAGAYSGAEIAKSTVAASSTDWFADSPLLEALATDQARGLRRALARLVPKKLDSTKELRFFRLSLEGKSVVVVQRAFIDQADQLHGNRKLIFALGTWDGSEFKMLHWKEDVEDVQEQVLSTIRLKTGREFLVTVLNDPESHSYHIYGIKNGQLTIVYEGGGSAC